MKRDPEQILRAYEDAKKIYAAYGVDTDAAIAIFKTSTSVPQRRS